jgi:hypothetical protein
MQRKRLAEGEGKKGRKKNFNWLLGQERKELKRPIKNWKERERKSKKTGEKELEGGKIKTRKEK